MGPYTTLTKGGKINGGTVRELAEPGRGAPSLLLLDLGLGMVGWLLVLLVLAARTPLSGCLVDSRKSANVFTGL